MTLEAKRSAERIKKAYDHRIKTLERAALLRRPWFERDRGMRFEHDKASLSRSDFSGLIYQVDDQKIILTGIIPIVSLPSGITHHIKTTIKFPDNYPHAEPHAFDADKRFTALADGSLADRHLGTDGWCCLWLPSRTEWIVHDPDSLVAFLRQLTVFFERQLIYDVVKRWPGPEYAHGDAGYVQDIRETLNDPVVIACYAQLICGLAKPRRQERCPCGGDRYELCHKPVFDMLTRRLSEPVVERLRHGNLSIW